MQTLREKVVRGTPDFPLKLYKFKTDRVDTAYHWHPEIEIVYVKSGNFSVTINNEAFKALPETIFVVNTGELHSMADNDGETVFYSVVFYPELLDFDNKNPFQRSFLDPLKNGMLCLKNKIDSKSACFDRIKGQFERIIEAENKPHFAAVQTVALYEILIALLESGEVYSSLEGIEKKSKNEVIKKVISYIDDNLGDKITLNDLADCAKMSEKYFCTFFKNQAGCTPIEHINRVRIERACELMTRHNMSVTDAAFETGFESLSYFIRRFKKQMGVSPSEYKKSAKN